MAIDFFNYIDDIRQFAPQIKSDARLDSFRPFLRSVKQRLEAIVSKATYADLLSYYQDLPNFDENSAKGKATAWLRSALANFMAIPYFTFEASERNNTDNALYRYQEDAQREIYLDNAWAEMNQLLEHMDANITDFPGYAATERFKLREKLYLKSPASFTRYFGIDNSAYFYANTILLQEEVIRKEVKSRIKGYPTVSGDDLKWSLGKAVAYRVMANACLQLDYTELPRGIRNDIQKEVNAKKVNESEAKEAFFVRFNSKADEFFKEVDNHLNASRNSGEFTIAEDTQTEDDKFFMPT